MEYAIGSAAFLRDDIAARRGDVAAADRLVRPVWKPVGAARRALRAEAAAAGERVSTRKHAELRTALYEAFSVRDHVQTLRVTDQRRAPSAMPLPIYWRWQRGLLDSTLVIWGGEFGRTPMNEGATARS